MLHSRYAVVAVDAYGNESEAAIFHDEGYCTQGCAEAGGYVETAGRVELPADVPASEYLLVCDLAGRHVMTLRRSATPDLSALAPGGYELRTLARKGISHRIMLIWKNGGGRR